MILPKATFIFVILIFALFLNSCLNGKRSSNPDNYKSDSLHSPDITHTLSIDNCLPKWLDTISDNFAITYKNKDSFYSINLVIMGINSDLPYKFDCQTPEVIVPVFNSYYKNYICLERSCGNHCLVYYLFKLNGDTIIANSEFYQAVGIDLVKSQCAIIDTLDPHVIRLINYNSLKESSFKLAKNRQYIDILDFEFKNNVISILFEDSTNQVLEISELVFK